MPNRSTLLATTALTGALLVGPAGTSARAQFVPPPQFTWTGYYFGAHGGYGWGDTDVVCTACDRDLIQSPKPTGALVGLQVGTNYQSGVWVWGLESDFSVLLLKDTTQFPSIDPSKATDELTSRYDWLGTLRARGGVAAGPALFYGTGGLAAAGVRHTMILGLGDFDQQSLVKKDVRFGWAAGGGIEYALGANASLKFEYLHVHLQDTNMDTSQLNVQLGASVPPATNLRFRNQFDLVRAGVNFRF